MDCFDTRKRRRVGLLLIVGCLLILVKYDCVSWTVGVLTISNSQEKPAGISEALHKMAVDSPMVTTSPGERVQHNAVLPTAPDDDDTKLSDLFEGTPDGLVSSFEHAGQPSGPSINLESDEESLLEIFERTSTKDKDETSLTASEKSEQGTPSVPEVKTKPPATVPDKEPETPSGEQSMTPVSVIKINPPATVPEKDPETPSDKQSMTPVSVVKIKPPATKPEKDQEKPSENLQKGGSKICSLNQRYKLTNKVCNDDKYKDYNFLPSSKPSIMVNHELKIIFCSIPKVAHTSFQKYFISLYKNMTHPPAPSGPKKHLAAFWDDTGFKHTLGQLTPEEQENVTKTYFKFIVVRHPLERLISCYNNKVRLGTSELLAKDKFLKLIKQHHPDFTMDKARNVTFAQFMSAIAESYKVGLTNMHWNTYDETCAICDYQYDHIFHTETLVDDSQVLLKHLRSVKPDYAFPEILYRNSQFDTSPTKKLEQVKRYFDGVDREILSEILGIYGLDMEVFGYQYNTKSGASCSNVDDNGNSCC